MELLAATVVLRPPLFLDSLILLPIKAIMVARQRTQDADCFHQCVLQEEAAVIALAEVDIRPAPDLNIQEAAATSLRTIMVLEEEEDTMEGEAEVTMLPEAVVRLY